MEAHTAARVSDIGERRYGGADARINVLFLTIDITIGGAERLVLDLARNMDRTLFAPSVGWFSHEAVPREFEELGIPLFPIRKGPGLDWRAMRRLAQFVRDRQIHVINAHHFMSFFYACYAAKIANRVGLVYTEHSEADVLSATGMWRAAGVGLLRLCDRVVGVSPRVSAALSSHFRLDAERIQTIENGVDLARFARTTENRSDVRRRLGLEPTDVVIGHVANFRRNKNHLFLVRAFREAFGHRSDVKLLLVGQGFPGDTENSEPEVAAFVRAHGLGDNVRMLGYRPDVNDLLGAMDIFCLVSYKEGLPLSVIEAMATGLPVLATNIDGLKDVVRPDVTGMLVEPDDVAALARTLDTLASDGPLRARLGESAREVAKARYSFSRCLSETQELFAAAACARIVSSTS